MDRSTPDFPVLQYLLEFAQIHVHWTARRSNQSILKEINPEYSSEGLMLKLKLQYCGHLMGRDNSLKKTLMLGKIEGRRRRGGQRMRWLDGISDSMDMSLSKLREMVKDRDVWRAAIYGVAKSQTRLNNNRPLSWWCHPIISPSVVLFSSCPRSFPASRPFPMSQLVKLKCV